MMYQILFLILILVIILLAYFLIKKEKSNISPLVKINQTKEKNRIEIKNKILELFKKQDKIHNRDVENLLSVSDATATNYLEELEKEGAITQNGEIGRGVFYTKING